MKYLTTIKYNNTRMLILLLLGYIGEGTSLKKIVIFTKLPFQFLYNRLFWLSEQTQSLNTCNLFSCTTCFGRVYRPSSARIYNTIKWKVYWAGGLPFRVKTLKICKLLFPIRNNIKMHSLLLLLMCMHFNIIPIIIMVMCLYTYMLFLYSGYTWYVARVELEIPYKRKRLYCPASNS